MGADLAVTSSARADAPSTRWAVVGGPAFWLEFGGDNCRTEPDNVTTCSGALHSWYGGMRAQADYDLTPGWRLGGQLGLGGNLTDSYGSAVFGESWTLRHWLVPMGVHLQAHVEPRQGISLWIGPELLYALWVDKVARSGAAQSRDTGDYVRAIKDGSADDSSVRSGIMVGPTMGIDARLWRYIWLGSELALALSLTQDGQVDGIELKGATTAMLRTGPVLRVQL